MAVLKIDRRLRARSAASSLGGRLAAAARIGRGARVRAGLVRTLELAALCVVGLLSAAFFWMLFAPMPDPPARLVAAPAPVNAVNAKSPFGETELGAVAAVEDDAEFTETTLNLALHGTWIDPQGGAAIIKTTSGEQKRFAAGDEIEPGVVLSKVMRDQVIISRAGIAESLRLENRASETASRVAPAQTTTASGAPSDGIASIGGAIRVTPRTDAVGAVRLALAPRGSPTAFAALGLEPGDILVSIDGRPLSSDIASEIERMAALAGRESVEIAVERDGAVMPITVPVSAPLEEQTIR